MYDKTMFSAPSAGDDGARPRHLTEDAARRYRRDGFLHVRNVLNSAEVSRLAEAATVQLDRETTASWEDHEGSGSVMDWVVNPEVTSPEMRHLALHPVVASIAEQLAGIPLRMFKSELLRKRAADSAATPPHIDEPAFPISAAPVTLTAWVALVDVPVERGCMTFLPGSHHRGDVDIHDFMDPISGHPELEWTPRVAVPLRAGDCTFHHARLIHSAGANNSDLTRLSLATVYMDAEATYQTLADIDYQDVITGIEPGGPFDDARYPRLRTRGD